MSKITIRKATLVDLDAIKTLADGHKDELGFVLRPALANSIKRDEIFVAENNRGVIGFVDFHHRQDAQTTLYHIAIQPKHRRRGIGHQLIGALAQEAGELHKEFIQLKCPVDLEANNFYECLGFSQTDVQPGKHRDLVIWRKELGKHDYGHKK